jgi:hypothetical protein
MKEDRNKRTEERAQSLYNAEAFRDYIRTQTRRALASIFAELGFGEIENESSRVSELH